MVDQAKDFRHPCNNISTVFTQEAFAKKIQKIVEFPVQLSFKQIDVIQVQVRISHHTLHYNTPHPI